ncbi:Coq4 family protein [Qipengyuania sp. ASV99]|uniref:Coq4 family protein n=1 Tax=Qipengyuania sp. ASV99 TaxID=3399681 RepID=UPI003A4C5F83
MANTTALRSLDHQNPAQIAENSFLLREVGDSEGGTLDPSYIARTTANGVETMPVVHPDRVRPRLDFPKAWHHFSKVLKDKERTDELIGVFDALPWRAVGEEAAAFLATEKGQAIFQSEPYLPDLFDDHATLRKMPKGSFAHAYCDFMEREGLTAAGLVEASGDTRNGMAMLPDGVEWYGDRLRDTHDILHILTGYGRDTLGEQCVLGFLFHQRPSPGHLFVAWAGTLLMRVKLKSRAPVIGALREARRHGRLTQRIVEQPIRELLPLPLEEVRRRLNVPQPTTYLKVLDVWRSEGIDPHAFLAKQEA